MGEPRRFRRAIHAPDGENDYKTCLDQSTEEVLLAIGALPRVRGQERPQMNTPLRRLQFNCAVGVAEVAPNGQFVDYLEARRVEFERDELSRQVRDLQGELNHAHSLQDKANGTIHILRSMLDKAGFLSRQKMGEDIYGNKDFATVRIECQLQDALDELEKEKQRLDAVIENYWSVHEHKTVLGKTDTFSVYDRNMSEYITQKLGSPRAAIDSAIKSNVAK